MKYLAILGRQPEISIAELEAVSGAEWREIPSSGRVARARLHGASALTLALQGSEIPSEGIFAPLNINRFGGTLKLAVELEEKPLEYLQGLPEGKITIGVSDYSGKASRKSALDEALKLKKILVRHGRSVRVVENKEAVLSTATSLHNGLSGKNERKVELIKLDDEWYRVIGVQDIDAYAKRDQARPARDAKVGMLPPKLAQILINLCGQLEPGATVLDPFCGTGVVLQEALLMGYRAYGTDISERMVEYTKRNLDWLAQSKSIHSRGASLAPVDLSGRPSGVASTRKASFPSARLLLRSATGLARYPSPCQAPDPLELNTFWISQGDATSYQWEQPIDAVACEGYLGKPFSQIPSEVALKEQKQECGAIVRGFLKNLAGQIKSGTPVVIAVPAWLRPSGEYERLEIVDEIEDMGYNVSNKTREGLLYHRDGQVVARDILILRKK
ncbi:hypothetical protein IJG22_02350 [Candidatus Saccharibacteria bacterium]|nr:hypothetical protein [Candidatus Saccharibacteria bacterium]